MSNVIRIERIPEGIRIIRAPSRRTTKDWLHAQAASVISQAMAVYSVNGALSALDAPGNPFSCAGTLVRRPLSALIVPNT